MGNFCDCHKDEAEKEEVIKIIVLGASGVGKTDFINKMIYRRIVKMHQPTVAHDIHYKSVGHYKLKIYDTPGIEKYQLCIQEVLAKCDVILFVCNQTQESLDEIYEWSTKLTRDYDKYLIINKTKEPDPYFYENLKELNIDFIQTFDLEEQQEQLTNTIITKRNQSTMQMTMPNPRKLTSDSEYVPLTLQFE